MRTIRSFCARHARMQTVTRSFASTPFIHNTEAHLPRIAKPSFLKSLIPKPFRRSTGAEIGQENTTRINKPKTDNEFVIFIVLALVVGSNAINMLALRNDIAAFRRKSDARIDTLRDIIRRLRNGEEVDVKKELGTGDPAAEEEWQEVMEELATRDAVSSAQKRKEAAAAAAAKEVGARETQKTQSVDSSSAESQQQTTPRRPKFLM